MADCSFRAVDAFLIVVQAIRRGELREPERLMGFVRRQAAAQIDRVVHNRREQAEFDSTVRAPNPRSNPEDAAIFRRRIGLVRQIIEKLTETQFRLLKSRAKARLDELGKKHSFTTDCIECSRDFEQHTEDLDVSRDLVQGDHDQGKVPPSC
jgi:hypothetical protein